MPERSARPQQASGAALPDAAIIERSARDPEAFAILYDRHATTLHRYVARRLGDGVADDIVAETFLCAFRKRDRFDPNASPDARPWLYGIAANLIGKHTRSEVRMLRAYARTGADPVLTRQATLDDVFSRASVAAAQRDLAGALAILANGDREVLLLIAWADLSYAEVAAALGIPVGTVRSRLNRARTRVRAALGGIDVPSPREVSFDMNRIDDYEQIAGFRAAVPFPSEGQLTAGRARLLAAVTAQDQAGHRHRAAARLTPRWRPMVALAASAAIAVGAGFALTTPGTRTGKSMTAEHAALQATLAAKVLHAAAVRVARQPAIAEPSPGQWIYYNEVDESGANSVPASEGPEWVTFDGDQSAYYEAGGPFTVHRSSTSVPPPGTNPWVALNTYGISAETAWDVLGALPAEPHALLAVIARQVATPAGEQDAEASVTNMSARKQMTEAQLEFDYLTWILWNARLGGPPAALAAIYRAMATLPGITVQHGIIDAAGAPAIGVSDDGGYNELLLSPVTYQVTGWRWLSDGIVPGGRTGHPRVRAGTHWPPRGALIVSTAITRVSQVAAAGDR
ncbi:MAG TPA: sigma-70 family RNA polymerase sigma factor [Streptosporangiaceae bacterium]|nr:sigma-70 family RNA polymerase sigma factor [Streptosporangiaceae bacterium]